MCICFYGIDILLYKLGVCACVRACVRVCACMCVCVCVYMCLSVRSIHACMRMCGLGFSVEYNKLLLHY